MSAIDPRGIVDVCDPLPAYGKWMCATTGNWGNVDASIPWLSETHALGCSVGKWCPRLPARKHSWSAAGCLEYRKGLFKDYWGAESALFKESIRILPRLDSGVGQWSMQIEARESHGQKT